MNLHVIAYPELADNDFQLIQSLRKDHNSLYSLMPPHFTLVFSVKEVSFDNFSNEIRKQVNGIARIKFSLRCAVINKDAFSAYYDAFLVPDEGHSQIVKLQSKLQNYN